MSAKDTAAPHDPGHLGVGAGRVADGVNDDQGGSDPGSYGSGP
jgi:hypothetical protein